MENQLEKDIEEFIRPFIEMSPLKGVQFPLLPMTYTLWRKVCYKRIKEKYSDKKNFEQQKQIKRAFIKVSQRKLLPQYLAKINKQIDGKSVGWRRTILQADDLKKYDSPEYQQLLFSYCEQLYELELYIQLFYDLVSIPYSEIYSDNKQYLLNSKYKSSFYYQKHQSLVDKACQKIGKSILSKGLGKISETLLSSRVIYSMTGILGAFNPLAFAASLTISYAMESHQKNSKQKNLISDLTFLKSLVQKNLQELKSIYEMCLTSMQIMAELKQDQNQLLEKQKKRFLEILSSVLTEDWLEIKVTKEDQWQFVEFKNNDMIEQFEDIHISKSSTTQKNTQKSGQEK